MADAVTREVVYEIVTRVIASAASPPGAVEAAVQAALQLHPSHYWLRIEKVRIVSMVMRKDQDDVAQAG